MSDQQDAAHLAVGQLVQQIDPGVMLASFVLVAEVVGQDGSRSVWQLTDDQATVWSTLGLLEYGKAAESVALWTEGDDE